MKKQKISITLSADIVALVDQVAPSMHSRSAVIERVLRRCLRERRNAAAAARDLQLISGGAGQLDREAARVLDYQRFLRKPK